MRSVDYKLIVPFHDVDSMSVAWHGHYAKYFELARCQLLESFQYNYDQMKNSGYLWPIVDFKVKYVKPLRFNQEITVQAKMVEWEYRLKLKYIILDTHSQVVLTKGETTQVAVCSETNEMCFETPLVFRKKLGIGV